MYIEIDKALLKRMYNGDIQQAIKDHYYKEWTQKRIKGAFNRGNGITADLKRYIKDNEPFAVFMEI